MIMKTNTFWILFYVIILILAATQCAKASYTDLIQEIHTVPPERAENLSEAVKRYSDRYGVSPDLIMAIIWTESHFRNTVGDDGLKHKACGYMQVRTNTFYQVAGYRTTCQRLIYDWEEGIRAGIKYFAKLKTEYSIYSAISAYNAGLPIKSNYGYVIKVLKRYKKVKEINND